MHAPWPFVGRSLELEQIRATGTEAAAPFRVIDGTLSLCIRHAGRTNRKIAEHLVVSVRTVGSHLCAVYDKLGINDRTKLPRLFGYSA